MSDANEAPRKRDFSYSHKAGETTYPIAPYTVFKLRRIAKRKFKGSNFLLECDTYIWIVSIGKAFRNINPYDRKVRVIYFWRPTAEGFKHLSAIKARSIQMDSVTTALRAGYDVVATKCIYNRTWDSMKRFYRLIGVFHD